MIAKSMRDLVERRWPLLATVYRTVREEFRFARQTMVRTADGFLLAGDASMQSGVFEPEERRILQHELAAADVFVDIGANIGFYTCMARQAGKQVVAFEPLHANLRLLFANLEANGWGDVEVWPVALASRPGMLTLYGASTGASLVSGWAGMPEAYRTTVSVAKLDDVIGSRFDGKRMLIKMDVEGAEYGVLQGAGAVIARTPRPTWLIEITLTINRPEKNAQFLSTFEMFLDRGYRVLTADASRRSVSREELREWAEAGVLPPSIGYNWLFVPTV